MAEQLIIPRVLLDMNGDPVSGAKIYAYIAGTSTLEVVYSDEALTQPHPSPLVADAGGNVPQIWHAGDHGVKVVATDAADVAMDWSPLDPAPMTSSATTASNITFTPTTGNPANNVQQAIENATGLGGEVEEKAASFTVTTSDVGKVFECTADFTMSLTEAATLGNGFSFGIIANGGDVIIDPAGSELIDKASTYTLYDGQQAKIKTDGTKLFITPSGPRIQKFEANGDTFLGFDIPAGVNRFRIEFDNLKISTTIDALKLLFRKSGEGLPVISSSYVQQTASIINGVNTPSSGVFTNFVVSYAIHTGAQHRGDILVQGVNRAAGLVTVEGVISGKTGATEYSSGRISCEMNGQDGDYNHFILTPVHAGQVQITSMSGRILWDS